MITRRDFLQVAAATAAVTGLARRRLAPRRRAAGASGRRTCCGSRPRASSPSCTWPTCHAQLKPLYYREPSLNLGVGDASGKLPHLTGAELLNAFGISEALARRLHAELGRLRGAGQDLRPRRRHGPHGDAGQGDPRRARRRARAAARRRRRAAGLLHGARDQGRRHGRACCEALGVEATTGHWEFTLGARPHRRAVRRRRIVRARSGLAFLAGNVRDTDFAEPVFESTRLFEKGGVTVAVIGQAFPYTPIANPRWMMPNWSFGIREDERAPIGGRGARSRARRWWCCCPTTASTSTASSPRRVEGIDVILTAHTHDALPAADAGRQHAAGRLGLARQVPVAPRRGGGRRARAATSPTR